MGRRLKTLREERAMTRAELAEAAGISREYGRRLEAGEYDPTVGMIQKLAKAFAVPVTE
jgi:transcriptional regulator with XRE-family HTH domain